MRLSHYVSVTKVAKQMYSVNYLVRAGVPICDIICVCTCIILSVLGYACPVWHPGLTRNCETMCTKTLFKTAVSSPFIMSM